jgi:transaldolase
MTVYYGDTANLEQLKKLKELNLIAGCTTNPGIMAKEGRGYSKETIQQIIDVVNSPVSVELTSEDPQKMLEEARMYYGWNRAYVVVKVPFENTKGECQLAIVAKLAAEGIPTNVTCCMNLTQMFAAAQAGATYTSIFWGRVSDQGYNAEAVTQEIVNVFKMSNIKTKIIVGSLRQVADVTGALRTGADILTVTPDVLLKSLHHPRSVETQKEFLDTYSKIVGKS